ncbi:ATP-dependent DNA helicase PIF1-like protein, partial [Tanacetum coccineum]
KTIISWICSLGRIVLSVASSGIASLLMPGGWTAHLGFRIHMELNNESCCGIDVVSDLADLIRATDLIIWDEAPLQHRHAFEAVDRTFHDICRLHNPNADNQVFGRKVVVLGGDFRQILPVIPNASRAVVVSSAVNKSSSVWDYCKVFVLSINMRLRDPTLDVTNADEIMQFHNWLIAMGDGRLPCIALDGEDDATWITIPEDLLIPVDDNPVEAIVSSTFPDLLNRIQDINYLKERCILSPTNDVVDKINSHVLASMSGEMHELLSADTICSTTDNLEDMQIMYPPEFLNTLRFSGVPNHKLELKIGAPIILLRNTGLQRGLCNGTRLVITQITRTVLEAQIITGTHIGEKVFINRIDMTPTDSSWPFRFIRRQFPVKTSAQPSFIRPELFDRYVFKFVLFANLQHRIGNDTYLIDVAGVLRAWGPLQGSVRMNQGCNPQLHKIVIVDTSDIKLNVSLWGKCALMYVDNVIESKKDTNIVVVLTCCKVGFYAGGPKLKSTASSQIHLNIPIAETIAYSQRYKLVIKVRDNKEEIDCVLFNSKATPLLGITVDELNNKTITELVYSDLSISSEDNSFDTTDYAIHDENLGCNITEYEEKLMDELEWGHGVSRLKTVVTYIYTEPVVVETYVNDFTHDVLHPAKAEIRGVMERITKKRTKNEAKTTKPDSEWKSKEKTKSKSKPKPEKVNRKSTPKPKVKEI